MTRQGQDRSAHDLLELEREVYSRFGVALCACQSIERELIMIILEIQGIQSSSAISVSKAVMSARDDLDKLTMGELIKKLSKMVDLPNDFAGILNAILKLRNYLAHEFFMANEGRMTSTSGLIGLRTECTKAAEQLQTFLGFLNEISNRLFDKRGGDRARLESALSRHAKRMSKALN